MQYTSSQNKNNNMSSTNSVQIEIDIPNSDVWNFDDLIEVSLFEDISQETLQLCKEEEEPNHNIDPLILKISEGYESNSTSSIAKIVNQVAYPPSCNATIANKAHLETACHLCMKILHSPQQQTAHFLKTHPTYKKLYYCTVCSSDNPSRSFSRRDALTRHHKCFHDAYTPQKRKEITSYRWVNMKG